MSTPIKPSKFVLLCIAFGFALLANPGSVATAQDIQWRESLAEAKAEAAKTNRLVWLHFTADWCAPCQKLETFVFKNTGVIRTADRNVVAVRVNTDENDSLVKKLGVPKIPYDIVMTPGGETIVSRLSPRNSSDYLKIFNSLDTPLQNLNSGDRESINASINQLQGVISKASNGLRQSKSELDVDGPAHEMAANTVEGQRLARGVSSTERAAGIRQTQANLMKKKAELFIAKEEQRLNGSDGPKLSENPFFKAASGGSSTKKEDSAKVVSNQFLSQQGRQVKHDKAAQLKAAQFKAAQLKAAQLKAAQLKASQLKAAQLKKTNIRSGFLPPVPPIFTAPKVEKTRAVAQKKKPVADDKGFSLPKLTARGSNALSKSAERKSSSAGLPMFSDSAVDRVKSNDFAPVSDLKKSLRAKAKLDAITLESEKLAKQAIENPVKSPLIAKKPVQPQKQSKPTFDIPVFRKPVPTVRTTVAVPQAPAMVEGVVKIAETRVTAVEGQLVAAEMPIGRDFTVRKKSAPVEQRQVSRTDRLLDEVNFFESEKTPPQPAQVAIVRAQPAPQPQVVINLNVGSAKNSQPNQERNTGRIIRDGALEPANATAVTGNRARIKMDDIAAASRSKYALKGKCPVTLLTQGKWVDGEKEIGCMHRNRVYLFASAANREAFLANPDQLSPLLAGFDPVIFEETGKLIEGKEEFGAFMGETPHQRVVLFKTADTRDRFQKAPVKYLNIVRGAMTRSTEKDIKLR